MTEDSPPTGHNNPPPATHAEQMMEESAAFRLRASELITALGSLPIESHDEAARVTALGNMMRDHRKAMNDRRVALKTPLDEQVADIQRAFKGIQDLDEAIATARKRIGAWGDKLDEDARAAQREVDRLEAEARRLHAAGEIRASVETDLAAIKAGESLAARAPSQIRTQVGMASRVPRNEPIITDHLKLCRWLLQNRRADFVEFLLTTAKGLVRAKITPSGVEVIEVTTTRLMK